jgi:hypothetical protein
MLFRPADICYEEPKRILRYGNGQQRETKGNGFCALDGGSKTDVEVDYCTSQEAQQISKTSHVKAIQEKRFVVDSKKFMFFEAASLF